MTRIFVSYSRADSEFVRELSTALVAEGHQVWLDVYELAPSDDWQAAIERAVERTAMVVVVVSPGWLRSEFCQHELRHAVARGKQILALLRSGVEELPLPDELAGVQSIDAGDGNDSAVVFRRLAGAL